MHLTIFPDYDSLSNAAGELIAGLICENRAARLVLPTGETPSGLFDQLVFRHQEKGLDFSHVQIIALDEWGGLGYDHPLSCHYILRTNLIDRVNINPDHFFSLDGNAVDLEAECKRYSSLFARILPIDLAVLGLGRNGHIGFNEPAKSLPPNAYVARLAPETVARLEGRLGEAPLPHCGLTLGFAEIMQAFQLLLIVSGSQKAEPVQETLLGPLSTEFPASLLRLHRDIVVFMDEAAAANLDLQTLPEWVRIHS